MQSMDRSLYRKIPQSVLQGGKELIIKSKKGKKEMRLKIDNITEMLVILENEEAFIEDEQDQDYNKTN